MRTGAVMSGKHGATHEAVAEVIVIVQIFGVELSQPLSASGIWNAIVSTTSPPSPAAHSPNRLPDDVFVFAAMIASRSVHLPSFAVVSSVLLTVIVAAVAGDAGAKADTAAIAGRSSETVLVCM